MRTTVDTAKAASIPTDAGGLRPTSLRRRSPHARTAVLLAVLMVTVAACTSSPTPEVPRPTNRLDD